MLPLRWQHTLTLKKLLRSPTSTSPLGTLRNRTSHVNNQLGLRHWRLLSRKVCLMHVSASCFSFSEFTIEEIATHGTKDDCWIIVDTYVYDLSTFVMDHPGTHSELLLNTSS